MEIPVTSEILRSETTDGLLAPLSHSHTVGCVTPTFAANCDCDKCSRSRYRCKACTTSTIGKSYVLSIGNNYAPTGNNPGMAKRPQRGVLERLNEALADKGRPVTQGELAKIAGVKQPSVSLWKKAGPKLQHAIRLALELDVCVEWIYTERPPKRPGPPPDPVALRLWGIWERLSYDIKQQILGYALLNLDDDGGEKKEHRNRPPI